MTRRKQPKPQPKPRCKKGCTSFTIEKTERGTKRTCTVCKTSVTEVGRGKNVPTLENRSSEKLVEGGKEWLRTT
jgi:hypothetical protein